MADESIWPEPLVESVVHPTDFTRGSEDAFAHGLRLAVAYRSGFSIVHADRGSVLDAEWADYPQVRETLERWGLLEPGAPREAVLPSTGVRVEKVAACGNSVISAVLGYLDHHPTDLIVMGTRARRGLGRLIAQSIAEPLTQRAEAPTLLLPHGCKGFVSMEDGAVRLERVVIAVERRPRTEPAIQTVSGIARALGGPPPELTLVWAGDESDMPAVRVPDSCGLPWKRMARKGNLPEVILEVANELGAGMIAMSTRANASLLERFLGGPTERVARKARCPVLAVPA